MDTANTTRPILPVVFLTIVQLFMALANPALAEDRDGEERKPWQWRNGLVYESRDGAVRLHFGGRLLTDYYRVLSVDQGIEDILPEGQTFDDAAKLRRSRFSVSGQLFRHLIFKADYEFTGKDEFRDLYLGVKDIPWLGTVLAGHIKEPIGLEQQASTNHVPFAERSLAFSLLPLRNNGISFLNNGAGERITYSAGAYRDADGYAGNNGDGRSVTARITGIPWRSGEDRLLHLGLGGSFRDTDSARFWARPEANLEPGLVDTGTFEADRIILVAAEAATVIGPLSFQGEWVRTGVRSCQYGDPVFTGWYLHVSYFLTGEHRNYSTAGGTFKRVTPRASVFPGRGPGAWQLALRYSALDLDDGAIEGGELDNVTIGLNWHLHSSARMMLDYVHSELEGAGRASLLILRLQIDFQ